MTQFESLLAQLHAFRDERDWQQFHNSKDLALAISIEAAEVNELFLWKSAQDVDPVKLRHELADVMSYCLLLADNHAIDLAQAITEKIHLNAHKYPIEKAKGKATKYTDL